MRYLTIPCCCAATLALSAPAEAQSDWTFRIAPYVWAAGIDGQSGLSGLPPQSIDLSFGDVLDNLDMSLMLVGEMRRDRLSFSFDFFYADLGTTVSTPAGILASSIDVSSETIIGTLMAGYSVFDTADSSVDLLGGIRIWDVSTTFDFRGGALNGQSAGDSDTWVDPVIGIKFRHSLTPEFYLAGWAMTGGFGVSSDSLWDVMAGVGYDFSDRVSGFAGYRSMSVDYSSDGFVYDVEQDGPIIGAVIRF